MAENSKDAISRRRLLGGAAAGAGGIAAGGMVGAPVAGAKPANRKADVVVVGAGFAGLAAAKEIRKGGHSVAVLEARDRVGGRVLNADVEGGEHVELGGQWVGPGQDRVLALISRARAEHLSDQRRRRQHLLPRRCAADVHGHDPARAGGRAGRAGERVIATQPMAAEVPRRRAMEGAAAAEWDSRRSRPGSSPTPTQEARDLVDLGDQRGLRGRTA